MLTIDYIDVLNGACDLCGLPRYGAGLSAQDNAKLQAFIGKRLAQAARYHFWPDYLRNEERWFRQVWAAGTTYAAGAEVFYFGNTATAGGYYQALRALPLTVSSLTRVSTAVTATTSAVHGLTTGDLVTITGASQTEYNVTASVTVLSTTQFRYSIVGTPTTPATGTIKASPNPVNDSTTINAGNWYPCQPSYSGSNWTASTTYGLGAVVYYPASGLYYVCIAANTGQLPTDTTYFSPLVSFDRYVGFSQTGYTALGDVLEVWNTNPRVHRSAVELDFELSQNGVQIADSATSVWLRYRIRVPRLSGATYSATATYAVGNQIYFSSASAAGNFYDCVTATSAGESPDTAAAKWSVVQIPRIFEMYLKWGAYADWLVGDGQNDKGGIEDRRAESWLGREANIFMQQEQQRRPVRVLSR